MEKVLQKLNFEFFGKGKHKVMPEEFFSMERAVLLDLRAEEEIATVSFGLEHHRNITLIHIPLHQLGERLDEVPGDVPVGLFCSAGVRAAIAFPYLLQQGFEQVRILEGGYAPVVEALKPGKVLKASRS